MLNQMPISLFTEWQAYSQIEPFGEQRQDYRMGVAISTLMNIGYGVKPRMKPQDFIMDLTKTDEQRMKEASDNFDMFTEALSRKGKK